MKPEEAIKKFKERLAITDYLEGIPEYYEAMKLAVSALEKQIPEEPKHVHIKHGKHTWRKTENGKVDEFAFEYGFHNGVVCEVCGEAVCVCCNPDYEKLDGCEKEYWLCPDCEKRVGYKSKICDCGKYLDWK